MNRCLGERGLLRVHSREGSAAERRHLQLCADCAEHYEQLVEDLETIGRALERPAPAGEGSRALAGRVPWMPVAVACATLLAVIVDVAWIRRSSPVRLVAQTRSVSAFATDLSDALFAPNTETSVARLPREAPFLDAALDAGRPCTRSEFLAGECDDQLSALFVEGE